MGGLTRTSRSVMPRRGARRVLGEVGVDELRAQPGRVTHAVDDEDLAGSHADDA